MGKYIALHSLQFGREAIEPASEDGKSSGLFERDFDKATEARLIDAGAIRLAEGVEVHADPAPVETLDDTREKLIQGEVVKSETTPTPEPEGDGLDDKTVVELKAIAADESIDLGEATKKADIIAVIREARIDPLG